MARRGRDADSIVVRVSECRSVGVSGVGERERDRGHRVGEKSVVPWSQSQ